MSYVFHAASALAVFLHVLFFAMESLWWTRPAIRKVFGQTAEQAETTRVLAYNQGFYNLFLATGAAWGQFAQALDGSQGAAMAPPVAGRAVSTVTLCSMVGAALVLLQSKPGSLRGALLQGVPPLVALAALAAMVAS